MRHGKSGKTFGGRPSAQRKSLMCNLISSLVKHKNIKTTLPKAKELRRFAERMITIAKKDTVANRRLIASRLFNNKESVGIIFNQLAPHYQTRPGGYLRVLKCGYRHGDNAPMAIVQLVDYENISNSNNVVESSK